MDARDGSVQEARGAHARVRSRTALLGLLALVSFGLFVGLVVVLHFVQPELDPLRHFASEYVLGRGGWLMKLAFFGITTGIALLAYAVGFALPPETRSRWGGWLLTASATCS